MAHKSMRIALKNDRVEQAEARMERLERAIMVRLADIYKTVTAIDEGLDLVYENILDLKGRTLRYRWRAFKRWLKKH